MAKDKAGFKIKMTQGRETKGTYVYKNDDDGASIRSLYITKAAFKGDAPEMITVTVEES